MARSQVVAEARYSKRLQADLLVYVTPYRGHSGMISIRRPERTEILALAAADS